MNHRLGCPRTSTIGHMVVRYNLSLLISIVHLGVMIMFSEQGFVAHAHMSPRFLIAPLTGITINRMPLFRTILAACQAQYLFEALPSVTSMITCMRFADPCAIGNSCLAFNSALPVIVPPIGHFISLMAFTRSSFLWVICEVTRGLKE